MIPQMRSGGPKGKSYGGAAGLFGIIDADRSTQLFGGVLDLPEIIKECAVEIDTGVADANHGAVAISGRFDMDTFVLGAVDGAVEEVPEDESQEIFVGAQFEVPVYLVDDDRLSADGAGEKASH